MTDADRRDNGSTSDDMRTVTAFFDTQDAAEKARADLIEAGLSPDTISVVAGASAAASQAEEGGFWHALREFFVPDEDRYTYAEGLRRGGFALSVRTGSAHYDRAIDILDADGAVDIDEREKVWRSEGWGGYASQSGSTNTDLAYARADAGTAGFGASFAGEDGYAPSGSLTTGSTADDESRADTDRVGTGANEPGLLNPDMRERIGSGTATMTPATPTGTQDATMDDNAANRDRNTPSYATATAAEDATLGSPTRSGAEAPQASSTLGPQTESVGSGWPDRMPTRDESVRRGRVRGYIDSPPVGRQS